MSVCKLFMCKCCVCVFMRVFERIYMQILCHYECVYACTIICMYIHLCMRTCLYVNVCMRKRASEHEYEIVNACKGVTHLVCIYKCICVC